MNWYDFDKNKLVSDYTNNIECEYSTEKSLYTLYQEMEPIMIMGLSKTILD